MRVAGKEAGQEQTRHILSHSHCLCLCLSGSLSLSLALFSSLFLFLSHSALACPGVLGCALVFPLLKLCACIFNARYSGYCRSPQILYQSLSLTLSSLSFLSPFSLLSLSFFLSLSCSLSRSLFLFLYPPLSSPLFQCSPSFLTRQVLDKVKPGKNPCRSAYDGKPLSLQDRVST